MPQEVFLMKRNLNAVKKESVKMNENLIRQNS